MSNDEPISPAQCVVVHDATGPDHASGSYTTLAKDWTTNIFEVQLEHDRRHAAASAEVIAALVAWNERQVGPRNTYCFTLSLRGDEGQLLGGLVGEIYWMHLYVSVLWVHDDHRRQGFGRQLLARAEEIARARSCTVAYLKTASFQAPRFYEKCGYTEFGELPWAREPYVLHWFAKRLDASSLV